MFQNLQQIKECTSPKITSLNAEMSNSSDLSSLMLIWERTMQQIHWITLFWAELHSTSAETTSCCTSSFIVLTWRILSFAQEHFPLFPMQQYIYLSNNDIFECPQVLWGLLLECDLGIQLHWIVQLNCWNYLHHNGISPSAPPNIPLLWPSVTVKVIWMFHQSPTTCKATTWNQPSFENPLSYYDISKVGFQCIPWKFFDNECKKANWVLNRSQCLRHHMDWIIIKAFWILVGTTFTYSKQYRCRGRYTSPYHL